jgi:hypothetical protein
MKRMWKRWEKVLTVIGLLIMAGLSFWACVAIRPLAKGITGYVAMYGVCLLVGAASLVKYLIILFTVRSLKAETAKERYEIKTTLVGMGYEAYLDRAVVITTTTRAVNPFAASTQKVRMEIEFGNSPVSQRFPFNPNKPVEYDNYRFHYFGKDNEFLLVRRADEPIGYGTAYVLKK